MAKSLKHEVCSLWPWSTDNKSLVTPSRKVKTPRPMKPALGPAHREGANSSSASFNRLSTS